MTVVGLLHPGSMGAAIGRELVRAGHRVLWCPEGRSSATAARARAAGLERASDVAQLTERAEIILSICPPAVVEDVARDAAGYSFSGVWVEAYAISPDRSRRIAALFGEAVTIDGGIVGSPPERDKRTTLYLSGPDPVKEVRADRRAVRAQPKSNSRNVRSSAR